MDQRVGVYRVGEPVRLVGYADDFENAIAAVRFSLDEGVTWTEYPTAGAVPETGVNWSFTYTPERPGLYLMRAKSVNGRGELSAVTTCFAFRVEEA